MKKKKIRAVFYSPCTVYNKDSKNKDILEMSLADKILNLKQKILHSYTYLVETVKVNLSEEIIVFVAPEWYFKSGGDFDINADYTYDDMKNTFLELKESFKNLTSLLVIPGSFYYQIYNYPKPYIYNCTAAISCGKIYTVVHKMFDGDIPINKQDKAMWGMYYGIEVKYPKTDFEVKKLKKDAGYNYLVYNKKINKDFELENNDNSGIFYYGKLKFGLEICKDHQEGRLKNEINNETGELVDIQILIAAGLNVNVFECVTSQSGYIFYCDGDDTECKIRQRVVESQHKVTKEISWDVIEIGSGGDDPKKKYFRSTKDEFKEFNLKEKKYDSDTDVMIYDKAIEIKETEKIKETGSKFCTIC